MTVDRKSQTYIPPLNKVLRRVSVSNYKNWDCANVVGASWFKTKWLLKPCFTVGRVKRAHVVASPQGTHNSQEGSTSPISQSRWNASIAKQRRQYNLGFRHMQGTRQQTAINPWPQIATEATATYHPTKKTRTQTQRMHLTWFLYYLSAFTLWVSCSTALYFL